MKLSAIFTAVAAALLLSACSGLELDRTSRVTPTGSEFNRALFSEYLTLSRGEYAEGDYGNSDVYALRAQAVAKGTVVEPEEVSARKIPADKTQELATARGRLVAALGRGARERAPRDAAHAQAMFDCWMEEQEENFQPNDLAACRAGFFEALAKIETAPVAQPAPPPPETMVVFFDFNRSTLNADARGVIARIVARIRATNARSVVLSGYADRAGAANYNVRLSQRRVAAVRDAIRRAGVNVQFSVSSFGEERPAVQTVDGVREARNRRVEVRIAP